MIFMRLSSVIVILITLQSCASLNQELDQRNESDHEQTTVTPTHKAKARNLLGVVGSLVTALTGTRAPKRKIFHKQQNDQRMNGNKQRKFYPSVKVPERESVVQDDKNETQIDICSKKYWDVGFHKKVTFGTYNFGRKGKTYAANANCTVLYQGSRHCTPVMNCETPINLRKRVNGACYDDYLYISDGLGGAVKYCDNDKIKQMKPSGGGQDFYVKLITGPTNPGLSFTGFKCSVSCETKTNEAIQELRASKKTKKMYNNCVCGIPIQNDDQRIVGGSTAVVNEFPWLVPIVLKGTRQPICGGAIINDRHILTAAHCFVLAELGKDDLDVLVHAHLIDQSITGDIANVPLGGKGSIQGIGYNLEYKTDEQENSTRFGVEEVFIHPMFNDGYDNDVAIMKLNKKIDLISENGATPICLPKYSANHDDHYTAKAIVAGWGLGHEDAAGSNRLLQKLEDIPIIEHQKCEELFNETISDKMFCAGFLEGGKDSCTGDSGGPLIIKESNGQFKQIGIVSWGSGCARKDSPGVYTNVQELLEWINYHTSTDTNVQWCQESPGIID